MARTIVESKTKTAIIGFDEPFCVIGERILETRYWKKAKKVSTRDAGEQGIGTGYWVLDTGCWILNNECE